MGGRCRWLGGREAAGRDAEGVGEKGGWDRDEDEEGGLDLQEGSGEEEARDSQ